MGNQRTFASMAWGAKGKVPRRERFLAEMDAVIPWLRLLRLSEPHYPKAGNGRQPLGLEKMLRSYFLQHWFNRSDPQAEDAIYDSESMRRFARVALDDDVEPDETSILRLRQLLEKHQLTGAIFEAIGGLLEAKGRLPRSGTIVDATIIAAPSSTSRRPLSERWRMINRIRSRTRACGEHPCRVLKQLWGFTKVRYRGLAKNLARAETMFALANLYQVRRQLLPAGMRCEL